LSDRGEIPPSEKVTSISRGYGTRRVLVVLLIAVIVLGVVATYQQEQIGALNRILNADTTVIDGTRYYRETVPLYDLNGTTVAFHGVTFTYLEPPKYSYSNPINYTFSGVVRLSNGTLLDLSGRSVYIVMTGIEQPFAIGITFPDGSHEVYHKVNITASYSQPHYYLHYTYEPPVANAWFTQHKSPQAGVFWNSTYVETLTFYVSATS
jgi:hypothetical protein